MAQKNHPFLVMFYADVIIYFLLKLRQNTNIGVFLDNQSGKTVESETTKSDSKYRYNAGIAALVVIIFLLLAIIVPLIVFCIFGDDSHPRAKEIRTINYLTEKTKKNS